MTRGRFDLHPKKLEYPSWVTPPPTHTVYFKNTVHLPTLLSALSDKQRKKNKLHFHDKRTAYLFWEADVDKTIHKYQKVHCIEPKFSSPRDHCHESNCGDQFPESVCAESKEVILHIKQRVKYCFVVHFG